jgi:diacylglycerol kinase (ATP)
VSEEAGRRFLVVWNRSAGRKAGIPTNHVDEETLRRAMATHGLGDELFASEDEAAARERIAAAAKDGYDVIVAAGGDGTAGLIARQLLGHRTALAVLPLGSAMNIARSLGVPRDLDKAAAIAAGGRIRAIDVGESGDRVFFEIASIGLDAALFEEAQRIDRGRYRSLIDLVRVLVRYRPARIRLTLDGRTSTMHALMIAVANAPYTGLGLTLAPEAVLDDGRFDITVFRGFSRWQLIRHLGAITAGRHRYSPKVTTFRAKKVVVEAHRRLPVRADADDLGTTPATFTVRPGALRVVTAEMTR